MSFSKIAFPTIVQSLFSIYLRFYFELNIATKIWHKTWMRPICRSPCLRPLPFRGNTMTRFNTLEAKKESLTLANGWKLFAVFSTFALLGFGCSKALEPSSSNDANGAETQATNSKDPLSPKLALTETLSSVARIPSTTHFRCEIDPTVGADKPVMHKLDVPYGSNSAKVTAAFTFGKLGPEIWTRNYSVNVNAQCIAGDRRGFSIVECKFTTRSENPRPNRIEISLDQALIKQALVREVKINQAVWYVNERAFPARCWAQN
jgi:hypothetical protein